MEVKRNFILCVSVLFEAASLSRTGLGLLSASMGTVVHLDERREQITSYDPATGEEVGRVAQTSVDEVRGTVGRSRAAFNSWRKTSFSERRQVVMKAREVILVELDEIATLISRETGKPVGEAISMEIAPVLDLMQYFARNAERLLRPRKIGIGLYSMLGRSSKIVYHPLGVVAIIPAWNYPFSIPLGEAAMALMAGNTVVIKPSELTPVTGLKIGEIFEKAGAPMDVVQVVTGDGRTGASLVEAAPDKIMFTGSVATGKSIAESAAKNLTSVVLELGGKDPMIVFEDANLELAADAAVWGAFCNSGQSCSSVERLYVHETVADRFAQMLVERTKNLKQGIGTDSEVSIGAMSSERQIKIVEDHVEQFRKDGATILTGGKRRSEDTPVLNAVASKEYEQDDSPRSEAHEDKSVLAPLFYEPTIITNVRNDMRAMQEETFGPTLPIATFRTEQEAIELANDSEFGLTASVWTGDISKGKRVAKQIEAGSVTVNEVLYTHGIGQTPWGGFKNSGRGRTHGLEGLMELVQPQHIHVNRLAMLPNAWWMPYSANAVTTFRGFARYFATGSALQTARLLPALWRRISELRRSKPDAENK